MRDRHQQLSSNHTGFALLRIAVLIILITAPVVADSDSLRTTAPADTLRSGLRYSDVRGIERDRKSPYHTSARILNMLFWPPRFMVDTILRTAAFSAVFIDEKRIIKTFKDIFYLYERKLGWYPVLNAVTGSPRGLGASIFFRDNYFGAQAKAVYSNRDIWGLKGELSQVFFKRNYYWQIDLEARLSNDDNFRFYGIGPDPLTDTRSNFLPNTTAERGFYAQRRVLLMLNLGVRTSANWEFFLTNYYQKRTVRDPAGDAPDHFSNIFDVTTLPGAFFKSKKIYNELSARFDNRSQLKIIQPGIRIESYLGLSNGLKNDNNRLLRVGIDAMAFVPVLRNNRLLVPRLIFDMIEELNDRSEIAFVEYPRHLEFRGASSKVLLRSDKYKLQTSLDYQWPLTYFLNGHLFMDYLTVAPDPGSFFTGSPPWAAGFGIDFHTSFSEVARLIFSHGSEGLFIKLDVGLSSLNKDRSDWK